MPTRYTHIAPEMVEESDIHAVNLLCLFGMTPAALRTHHA